MGKGLFAGFATQAVAFVNSLGGVVDEGSGDAEFLGDFFVGEVLEEELFDLLVAVFGGGADFFAGV